LLGGGLITRSYVATEVKKRTGLVFCCLLFIYFVENMGALSGGTLKAPRLLIPVLWLGVAFLVWYFPRPRAAGRLRLKGLLQVLALICGGLYLIVMAGAGFIDGFGRSPYAFTPLALLSNFFYAAATITGMELARAYLLNGLSKRNPQLLIIPVALIFLLFELSINKLSSLNSWQKIVNYAGTTLLPGFSESLLVSYLAYLGGPIPALLYKAVVDGFSWFSPVLPNPGWVLKTLLGSIVPLGCLILVQYIYHYEAREMKRSPAKKESMAEWLIVSVLCILVVWFAVGLFPIYPSVIATGSMEPLIKPGDVIILKKLGNEEIKPGDVIHYWQNNIFITHRVINVIDSRAKIYQTKGDNNDAADSQPVYHQQVKGKLLYVIPKAGWPSLLLRSQGSQQDISGEDI